MELAAIGSRFEAMAVEASTFHRQDQDAANAQRVVAAEELAATTDIAGKD
jgi:hypothetical protein